MLRPQAVSSARAQLPRGLRLHCAPVSSICKASPAGIGPPSTSVNLLSLCCTAQAVDPISNNRTYHDVLSKAQGGGGRPLGQGARRGRCTGLLACLHGAVLALWDPVWRMRTADGPSARPARRRRRLPPLVHRCRCVQARPHRGTLHPSCSCFCRLPSWAEAMAIAMPPLHATWQL